MEMQITQVKGWIQKTNDKIQENKDYLSSLDRAIGDGDHGVNMARGFEEVNKKISNAAYNSISEMLKDTAMTLLSKVGGASGPLYGTAFLKMSQSLQGTERINNQQLYDALHEALLGLKHRGKAVPGDKTLIDVWEPVVRFFQNQIPDLNELKTTAENAMNATIEMTAKKGRAAYLKERSAGHLDPGSVSSYYLFEALSDILLEGE